MIDLIELTLNHGHFTVRPAHTLAEAIAILDAWQPDIAVIEMDHAESAAFLGHLRAPREPGPQSIPALGLTRRGDLKSHMRAYELGVDDILTVPFLPEDLLARTIAATGRTPGRDRSIVPMITVGGIQLDILNRRVHSGDSVAHLNGIEHSLLYLLASRSGSVVTHEEIVGAIWGPDFAMEGDVVDRHIQSLRIKLQASHRDSRFIATVPGHGYQFISSLTNLGWDDPI